MKLWKIIRNILLGVVGLVLLLLVALQILLRPGVLTGIVNGIAADYVEGDVAFRQVKAHVIKSFPYLNVEADDFSVTYPHDRYAQWDSLYGERAGRFGRMDLGRSPEADTLASFRKFILSINYLDLLDGTYNIHRAELQHPRIFAHYYDSTAASWDILPIGKSKGGSKPLPPIRLQRVLLSQNPLIVYTNPSDTLSFRFNRLSASLDRRAFSLDADATAGLLTQNYGRLRLPLALSAEGTVPEREDSLLEVSFRHLGIRLSDLAVEAKGDVVRLPEGWDILVDAEAQQAPLGELIETFRENFPALQKWKTDAVLDLEAHVQGVYGGGETPSVTASVKIPDAFLDHESLGRSGRISLDAVLETDDLNRVDADVSRLLFDIAGAKIDVSGKALDILGKDPEIALDARIRARVDSLARAFTRERGIDGSGSVDADLHGKVRLSQLNLPSIGNANIDCSLLVRNLALDAPGDSLQAFVRQLDARLQTRGNTLDQSMRQGARVLALQADADTLDVTYKEDIYVRGTDLDLLLQNSAEILKGGKQLTPLMGRLRLAGLELKDDEGMALRLRENSERFRIVPATSGQPSPRLSLASATGLVHFNNGADSYILDSLRLDLAASRHQAARSRERRPRQRDTLRRNAPIRVRDAFSSADISINLSQTLTQYVRDWDFSGEVGLKEGLLMLPSFPLLTSVQDLQGTLDNDKVDLSRVTVRSGVSDLSASARLTGLRRALLSRGRRAPLKLEASVESDYIDANELMRAYAYYTTYRPEGEEPAVQYEALDTARSPSKLFVLPSNLDLTFSLEGHGVKYDSLLVNWLAADVAMRDRTIQITNTVASSNMGDIYFEGFYATRSKEDIKAGFDLNLVDITAEKVITLFPAVDTIMPMLTSFAGDLDCELAATSDLDTLMNLVLPSVDGILKISGKGLSLKESEEFTRIARMLMFKNREEARVDNMAVTGMVRDNTLEVFPFVLDVDRYLFAASGIQHLDRGYDYHISVIRSPLLLKFGLNAWGDTFDKVHYGIGLPKYRSANVPVFTKQLDTVQYSLVAAIHNVFELGVEKAIAQNNSRQYLQSQADEIPELEHPSAAVQDSLRKMAALYEDVIGRVNSRRDALREEVLELEERLAIKNKEEDEQ